jgi:hypothetical protein
MIAGFILITVDGPALAFGVVIPKEGYRIPRFAFGGADFIMN